MSSKPTKYGRCMFSMQPIQRDGGCAICAVYPNSRINSKRKEGKR